MRTINQQILTTVVAGLTRIGSVYRPDKPCKAYKNGQRDKKSLLSYSVHAPLLALLTA